MSKLISREAFDGRWKVTDNVLEITYSNGAAPEKHCLRDINTLIFLSRSYRNAHRVQSVGG